MKFNITIFGEEIIGSRVKINMHTMIVKVSYIHEDLIEK